MNNKVCNKTHDTVINPFGGNETTFLYLNILIHLCLTRMVFATPYLNPPTRNQKQIIYNTLFSVSRPNKKHMSTALGLIRGVINKSRRLGHAKPHLVTFGWDSSTQNDKSRKYGSCSSVKVLGN